MKHRLKISDNIGYLLNEEVRRVLDWVEINIGPIKLRTESGYIRAEGNSWRIIKEAPDYGWFLEVDEEHKDKLVWLSLSI